MTREMSDFVRQRQRHPRWLPHTLQTAQPSRGILRESESRCAASDYQYSDIAPANSYMRSATTQLGDRNGTTDDFAARGSGRGPVTRQAGRPFGASEALARARVVHPSVARGCGGLLGSVTTKVVPSLSECTSASPPCARAISRTMYRPSPNPAAVVFPR